MARTYTRAEIRTRALFLADMVEGSNEFASTARVDDLINVHAAWLYEKLIQAGPPDYFSSSVTITSAPVNITLNGTLNAARVITGVFANESNGTKRLLEQVDDNALFRYTPITGTVDATVEVVPALTVIATGAANDVSTFEGLGGFEDLICLRVARDLKTREQTDLSAFQAQIAEYEQSIPSLVRRRGRGSYPIGIVDDYDSFFPWTNQLAGYRLRGSTLEFFTR